MDALDPELLARWSGGAWINGRPERITGVGNDTRSLVAGELFAALVTPNRAGHDFLSAAIAAGASGALTQKARPEIPIPQLVVRNVDRALADLAIGFRQTWTFPVVGVTGSCGKTTCKELLSRCLGRERALSTKGNLNNLIGVPMSILRAEAAGSRFAVLEAGISEMGEMDQLAAMIDPEVAIFTAIGPAHLSGLGSERAVAAEKGRLAQSPRARAVFAGETCERYAGYLGGLKVKLVKPDEHLERDWGYRTAAASGGETVFEQRVHGRVERYRYRGAGKALASNVALAVAAASHLGVSAERIGQGLSEWEPPKLRGEWRRAGDTRAYVDCYNANPLSMRDALETFVATARADRPRLFIIGCMEELGEFAASMHEEIGIEMPFRKEDFLLVLGGQAASVLRGMENSGHDMSHCEAIRSADSVRERVLRFPGDVFLKGSRRYRLEDALGDAFMPENHSAPERSSC